MKTLTLTSAVVALLAVLLCSCGSAPEKPSAPEKQSAPAATSPTPALPEFGIFTVTPDGGSGREQVFTVRLQRTPANPVPALVGLLINKGANGSHACYVFHAVASQRNLLVNDAGAGSRALEDAPFVGNKQCDLLADDAPSSLTNDALTFTVHVRFKPGFAGPKQIFVVGQDANGTGSNLHPVGKFKVE